MAVTKMEAVLTAFIVATAASLWAGAEAQSGCTNVLLGLSPCLSYITGNSSTPSSSCCSQLSSVIKSQPECLCQALRGGAASSLGLNINQTQAMALPGACNVQTPSTSCTGASGSTPPISPTGTQKSPTAPSSGTGTNSKTPITTVGESSSASSTKVSFTLFAAVMFLVSSSVSTFRWGGHMNMI